MNAVETYTAPHIPDGYLEQLAAVSCLAFPNPETNESQVLARLGERWPGYSGPPEEAERRFIIRDGGRVVANATLFPRRILTTRGPLVVGALAGVMTHPDVRGRGFGKAVVRAAFDCVNAGEFPFSLFQTGEARGFYEKLGCQLVTNSIVNSLNTDDPKANPFCYRWAMRYPAGGDWPEGEIDLLGWGY